jgi:uncharacterized protein (DUF305 family)
MIMHHRGAVEMVQQLVDAAHGDQEDGALMTYATNVSADQAAEIGRMGRMLAAMTAGKS